MRWSRTGVALLALLATVAVAAPLLAPYDPNARSGAPFARPSRDHLLGTNDVGQDLLSELIFGARVSLGVGVSAALVATGIGALVGVSAGYARGWLDVTLMRLVDVVLSLPPIPFAIVLGVFVGPGLATQLMVIAAVLWAPVARELRAQVLSVRERDHIQALRAMGAPARYVIPRHLLPAVAPLVVPQFILAVKTAVVLEASLAFLGLGDVTTKSWGSMLSVAHGRSAFLTDAWLWWVLPPGLAIAATVLAFALLGYGVEAGARPVLRTRRPQPPARRAATRRAAARRAVAAPEDLADSAVPLRIEGLSVGYGENPAVADVHLEVAAGQVLGLVGESGSGKSTVAAVTCGLLAPAGRVLAGRVLICGVDVTAASAHQLRALRGRRVALVPQEAMSALNPVHTVRAQLVEAVRAHRPAVGGRPTRAQARHRADELLTLVGLDPARAGDYPHQLSGGMRQRVALAIALAAEPALLVADEPTSGLDVLVQAEILELLADVRTRLNVAMLIVSHDLPVLERIADRIAVMQAGRVVEQGSTAFVFAAPFHPHTRQLMAALETPEPVPAPPPSPRAPLLQVSGLAVSFGRGAGRVDAVRGLDLHVDAGEIVALVGGSGAGKSTVARVVAGLVSPDDGRITVGGTELPRRPGRAASVRERGVALVFQDPYAALPPTRRVAAIVGEPLVIARDRERLAARVDEALHAVRLDPRIYADRYPHQLSGGERQRVAIVRALIVRPRLIVADEPTGMLDASMRRGIVDLLADLRTSYGLAVLLVTHDLAVARGVADRVVVMQGGQVVESGPAGPVFAAPAHAYTAALVRAGTRTPLSV